MKNFLSILLNRIIKYSNDINKYLNNLNTKLIKNSVNKVKILAIEFNKTGRYLTFTILNSELIDNNEVLSHIFNALKSNDEFINFGDYKVIITTAEINGRDAAFHPNVLINSNTTYQEYYDKVRKYIQTTYGNHGYDINTITIFKVRVFNMDDQRNKTIKITHNTTNKNGLFNGQKRSFSSSCINNIELSPNSKRGKTLLQNNDNKIALISPDNTKTQVKVNSNNFITPLNENKAVSNKILD